MWEGLASLFNNTLGSNGIGGAIGSMFTPSTVAIPAANLGDAMNSGTLMFDEATNLFSDGVKNYSMSGAGDLYSAGGSGSGGGLAGMMNTVKGYMPGEDTMKMLGVGGKMYSDISSGLNQSKATKILQDQYNRDSARLAKADADVEAQREQSNRVWGGGL